MSRVKAGTSANAAIGAVSWAPQKSIFVTLMTAGAIWALFEFTWTAFLLFVALTSTILCLGHSIGMHRLLIHRSFTTSKSIEYVLVYLGSIVGLGGPFTMIKTHDLRDWAQRQPKCHPFFGHKSHKLKDYYWQLHCDIHLKRAPVLEIEPRVRDNRFYRFVEQYEWLQHLGAAILLYAIGGLPFVLWGVCMRLFVCTLGHWYVGYLAHNEGDAPVIINTASIQGFNVKSFAILTFGESWHNNHHAAPNSARLGVRDGEMDIGFYVIKTLEKISVVKNVVVQPIESY